MVKSLVLRFVRVLVAGLVAVAVAFLLAHGKELLAGTGVPINIQDFFWPLISAALAAADKWARDFRVKNE